MIGAGLQSLDFYEHTRTVRGREAAHDPMIMEWCYTAHPPTPLSQWEPKEASSSHSEMQRRCILIKPSGESDAGEHFEKSVEGHPEQKKHVSAVKRTILKRTLTKAVLKSTLTKSRPLASP